MLCMENDMTLLNELNLEANAKVVHTKLICEAAAALNIENGIIDPVAVKAAWDSAEARTTITELNGSGKNAAMSRSEEADWVSDIAKTGKLDVVSKIVEPANGQIVMLGDTLGKIVDTDIDPKTKKVSAIAIQMGGGKEKVFPMDKIAGPKMVNGKPTWMLKK